MRVQLAKIAHARSGDKGDKVDIGLFAYDAETYRTLKREVTAGRVAAHFRNVARGGTVIYALDNLWALKIVLDGALGGGGSRSLRVDNLGKTMAAALLRMEIEAPESLPRLRGTASGPGNGETPNE